MEIVFYLVVLALVAGSICGTFYKLINIKRSSKTKPLLGVVEPKTEKSCKCKSDCKGKACRKVAK